MNTAADTQKQDVSFLLPIFLQIGAAVSHANADLTRQLSHIDKVISLAQTHCPDLPQLKLLRARRKQILALQREVMATDIWLEDQQVAMETGFAAASGIDIAGMLSPPTKGEND